MSPHAKMHQDASDCTHFFIAFPVLGHPLRYDLLNAPDDPNFAIEVGEQLCQDLPDLNQSVFGRIAIRSAFRSCEVYSLSNAMQKAGKSG